MEAEALSKKFKIDQLILLIVILMRRGKIIIYGEIWSGREDLNLRPLQPHCSALPSCATPRRGRNYITRRVLAPKKMCKITKKHA